MSWRDPDGKTVHFKVYYAGSGVGGKTRSFTALSRQYPDQVTERMNSGRCGPQETDRWLAMSLCPGADAPGVELI